MNEHSAILLNRSLISIKGADAENFLQSLISNDIKKLTEQHTIFTALLSPQGKFLLDFFIIKQENGLLLDVADSRAEALLSSLRRYKLRAKIDMEILADWGVIVKFPTSISASANEYTDPRLAELGTRLCAPLSALPPSNSTAEEYEKHRLSLGVPDGVQDAIPDRSFLLELGYEQLNGVSFNKGCYVGQEVTARSKHRGELNKHIFQIFAEQNLPTAGTEITTGERVVGEMRSSLGGIGIAILRKEAATEKLFAAGVKITAKTAKWW